MAFDAAADSSSDWTQIAEEISGIASDIVSLLSEDGIGSNAVAVKGSGTVTELITKGPKNILAVEIDSYDGQNTFQISARRRRRV